MIKELMNQFLTVSLFGLGIFWLIGFLSGSGIVPIMAVLVVLGLLLFTGTLNSGE